MRERERKISVNFWSGATKAELLELERAQRSLIKIMYNEPYRFPNNA